MGKEAKVHRPAYLSSATRRPRAAGSFQVEKSLESVRGGGCGTTPQPAQLQHVTLPVPVCTCTITVVSRLQSFTAYDRTGNEYCGKPETWESLQRSPAKALTVELPQHPQLLMPHKVYSTDDAAHVVYDWSGTELHMYLQQQQFLPESSCRSIMRQLLQVGGMPACVSLAVW